MSETKWTKGPWSVEEIGYSDRRNFRYGYTISVGTPECDIAAIEEFNDDPTGDEKKANAALIAAAPDLYEALQALIDEQNGPPLEKYKATWQAAMKKARAALARARGEK